MLDRAFQDEGFCVVRGPDLLWGGDVRSFRPPPGKFVGVIGGPPCQCFSALAPLNRSMGHEPTFGNLIPEFERCIQCALPAWFLMENVRSAPMPNVDGYAVKARDVQDCRCGGETIRIRKFTFGGSSAAAELFDPVFSDSKPSAGRAVTCDRRLVTDKERERTRKYDGGVLPHSGKIVGSAEMARLQGMPTDFLKHSPFTEAARRRMIGNGVPMAMGRTIAKAVRSCMERAEL